MIDVAFVLHIHKTNIQWRCSHTSCALFYQCLVQSFNLLRLFVRKDVHSVFDGSAYMHGYQRYLQLRCQLTSVC